MDVMYNFARQSGDKENFCYHSLIKLNGLSANRRKIHQVATKFRYLGLHYAPQPDTVTILSNRPGNDPELLQALATLAEVLPQETCYRVEAVCHDAQQNFGYLLYSGALYYLNSLAQPTKPRRLVVGQRADIAA